MFTGIIEEVGTVKEAGPKGLAITAHKVLQGTHIGDSIAVNGACLTVIRLDDDAFAVSVMPETVRRTNLGALTAGDRVNLERALALGDRLGGHLVQGHVEAVGDIASITPEADALLVRYNAPPLIMRYVVTKGFITVDGASLTVVERNESSFLVSLVPFTQDNTNLSSHQPGDQVNLESDILAKYVEQLLPLQKV